MATRRTETHLRSSSLRGVRSTRPRCSSSAEKRIHVIPLLRFNVLSTMCSPNESNNNKDNQQQQLDKLADPTPTVASGLLHGCLFVCLCYCVCVCVCFWGRWVWSVREDSRDGRWPTASKFCVLRQFRRRGRILLTRNSTRSFLRVKVATAGYIEDKNFNYFLCFHLAISSLPGLTMFLLHRWITHPLTRELVQ